MHFWCGVSALASTLQRRVFVDMGYFRWHCNQYILLVAPPGIVSKSTTSDMAMSLARGIPSVHFGPDVITWPALVTAFAEIADTFQIGDEFHPQCALTLQASEFGNLFDPQNRELVDLFVNLWDSKTGDFVKKTKTSGNDRVENPWINMIACTTPAWIASNFPESVIGGGFTSRCLFVYAEKKAKLVAYPGRDVPPNIQATKLKLIQDLEHIATTISGEYKLTERAFEYGTKWYTQHYSEPPEELKNDDRFGGYLARKQTHIHKLAMVVAAACHDNLVITEDDLILANQMITSLEADMPKVFAKIGRSEVSIHAERFIDFVKLQNGAIRYEEAYAYAHKHFPLLSDFEDIVKGAVSSGQLRITPTPKGVLLEAVARELNGSNPRATPQSNGSTSLPPSPPQSPQPTEPLPNHPLQLSSPIAPGSVQSDLPPGLIELTD
jgi:hypothetical protein